MTRPTRPAEESAGLPTSLPAALADLLQNTAISVSEAADRHLGPGFRQRVDGEWIDRPTFVARMRALRDGLDHLSVTVVDELRDGSRYAERHVIDLRLTGGEHRRSEVFVFGAFDPDGRFARLEESTRSA